MRVLGVLGVLGALGLSGAVGCTDLFHDTRWSTSCDGGAPPASCTDGGPVGDVGDGGSGGTAGSGGHSGGAGGSGGSGGGGEGGGGPVDPVGCSDGQREGYFDPDAFPLVASCSGAWSVPGIVGPLQPVCGRLGGDDGIKPDGIGCSPADLCAAGWHVCASSAELSASSPSGCGGASDPLIAAFFATGQSGPGMADCGIGNNDLFGCGTLGAAPLATCAPLDRTSTDLCVALAAPWSCGVDGLQEAAAVTKTAPDNGGVLCCLD